VTVVSVVLSGGGSAFVSMGPDVASAAFITSFGVAGSALAFVCLVVRAVGAVVVSCADAALSPTVAAFAVRRTAVFAGRPALFSEVLTFFPAVPAFFSALSAAKSAVPVFASAALFIDDAAIAFFPPAAAGLARPFAAPSVVRADVDLGRDALTGAIPSSALVVRVRLDAVRPGVAAPPALLAAVDPDRVVFVAGGLAASGPADFGALPFAEVVVADALAGAVERPAGAALAAGRAGGVVLLPVEPVRLVAVVFRGRVWFAATVTFGWAAEVVAAGSAVGVRPAETNRPFGDRRTVGGAVLSAGSCAVLREIAVVWSRVDRSPAAVRGPAEPFVAFAITYARVPCGTARHRRFSRSRRRGGHLDLPPQATGDPTSLSNPTMAWATTRGTSI
jgi:hypothetical protein